MDQTSIERLKDYLAQLPPKSQALLMREFERAAERGEDAAVANLVLDQLRRIVRRSGDGEQRSEDPAQHLFRHLNPFLVEDASCYARADPAHLAPAGLAVAGARGCTGRRACV